MANRAQILGDLAELLANFEGREYSAPITEGTSFFGDLGFASIEAVILGEALENKYGQELPFHQFLGDAAARQAEDISVGELADFLVASLP